MTSRRLIAGMLLFTSLCALRPVSVRAADAAADARHLIDQLPGQTGEHYWELARRLSDLGAAGLPVIEESARTRLEPAVLIACAQGLFLNDRREDGIVLLMKQVETGALPDRTSAVELLGSLVDGRSDYGDVKALAERIETVMDDSKDARLLTACSKTLFRMTGDPRAVRQLRELLEQGNEEARIAASLALGEIDQFETEAVAMLRDLASEPTDRGRLATTLLARQRLADQMERSMLPAAKSKYDFRVLEEIMRLIETRHVDAQKYPAEKLLEAAAKGVGSALDPFSEYLTETDKKRLLESIQGKYGGIGAYVQVDEEKWLLIDRPIYSGPAYKAGLRSGDKISQVEGEYTRGKSLEELVGKLKGIPGTKVKIKVYRRGWKEEREFELTRAEVVIDTARSQRLPGDVGYLQITSFGSDTGDRVAEHLKALQAAGIHSLIVDVRGNPGGYLNAAVEIVDHFLEAGKIVVTTRGKDGVLLEKYETKDDDKVDVPIMCLVNRGSASASEILSGAFQDHKKATLIGETTFGKGSVQHLIDLASTDRKTALRLTVAKYFLPSGRSIHREERDSEKGGVEPDIIVKPEVRDLWRDAELAKIEEGGATLAYLGEQYEGNRDLFARLAEDDHCSVEGYPAFEPFYTGLKTKLDREDIRFLLRAAVRRRVADDRGREFLVDIQNDTQLQRAIVELMKKSSQDVAVIDEYRSFAHKFDGAGDGKEKSPSLPK